MSGEEDRQRRNDAAFRYLLRGLQRGTGATSLAWAWLGLAAHDRLPSHLENEVVLRFQHVSKSDRSPHKLALLALAAQGSASSLLSRLLASRSTELSQWSEPADGEVLHV